jgi:hypothetical protein
MKRFIDFMAILILVALFNGCTTTDEVTTTSEIFTTTTSVETTTTTTTITTSTTTTTISKIPFFGIEEDFIQGNDLVSLTTRDIAELGAGIARTHGGPFVWDFVEPERGRYDFKATDKAVGEAADADITILASLWSYAMWDQGHLEGCKVGGEIDAVRDRIPDYRCKPQDMEAHNRFLKEMVERYDGDEDFGTQPITEEMKGKIRKNPVIYWEINNEVNIGDNIKTARFFQGSIEDYVELLKNSHETIKGACPHCQVIIAAPAGETGDYYREITALGGKEYFDVYNIHAPIQELQREIGTIDRPVILTEAGGMRGSDLAKEAVSLAADGVDSAMFSMTIDKAKLESKEDAGEPEGGIDPKRQSDEFFEGFLLHRNGSRTSAYYSLQSLTRELGGFTKADRMDTDGGVEGFMFSFEDRYPVYVYYSSKEGGKGDVNLSQEAEVVDLHGNRKLTKTLSLEKDNVYFVSAI